MLSSCTSAADPERTIIGYSSELSVRRGDTVELMVSAIGGGSYDADLVHIINGDSVSRYAHTFEVRPVEAPFAGTYEGTEQPLNLGSYEWHRLRQWLLPSVPARR